MHKQKIYGTLSYVTADTPAAQAIGGFKEGVGGAMCLRRRCDIMRSDLTEKSLMEDDVYY